MGERVKCLALLRVRPSLRKRFLNHKVLKYSRVTETGASVLEFLINLVHCRTEYTWPLGIVAFHLAHGFISVRAVEGRPWAEPSGPLPLAMAIKVHWLSLHWALYAFTSWPFQSPLLSVFILQMFQFSALKLEHERQLFSLWVLWRPGPGAVNPVRRTYQPFEGFVWKSLNWGREIDPFSSQNCSRFH